MSEAATEAVDVANLSYEAARDELRQIVTRLEQGEVPLDQTLALWQRGQDLLTRCRAVLDDAQKRIDQAASSEAAGTPQTES